jgi:hypothetical protein
VESVDGWYRYDGPEERVLLGAASVHADAEWFAASLATALSVPQWSAAGAWIRAAVRAGRTGPIELSLHGVSTAGPFRGFSAPAIDSSIQLAAALVSDSGRLSGRLGARWEGHWHASPSGDVSVAWEESSFDSAVRWRLMEEGGTVLDGTVHADAEIIPTANGVTASTRVRYEFSADFFERQLQITLGQRIAFSQNLTHSERLRVVLASSDVHPSSRHELDLSCSLYLESGYDPFVLDVEIVAGARLRITDSE